MRALVWLAGWLAPRSDRARWREEWLAELWSPTRSRCAASPVEPSVTAVGLLAAWGPARRGLRVHPTEALGEE